MAHFYPLSVTDIRRETRDSVVVTLEPRAEDRADFNFIQGQYLTFRRKFDGEELRRSYSICAGRDEGVLRVGIKKVADGWFSSWANDELKVGDTLEAMKPMGAFHVPLEPERARHYLGFAGGSGITPVISIIKTVLKEEPQATFTLVYGNRSANAIMFREELEDLKNEYMGRLNIIHILETEADIDLFSGLLTREKCDALFGRWVNVAGADVAFICGPEPMMLGIAAAVLATMRSLGQSVSMAALGGIAAHELGRDGGRVILGGDASGADATAYLSGYRTAMLVGSAIAVIGMFVSLTRGAKTAAPSA